MVVGGTGHLLRACIFFVSSCLCGEPRTGTGKLIFVEQACASLAVAPRPVLSAVKTIQDLVGGSVANIPRRAVRAPPGSPDPNPTS